MRKRLVNQISRVNQAYGKYMEKRARLEKLGDLVFWVFAFGAFWAYAWYGHIIGPWVDNLMGWGPHDVDSEGKIRWRQMWSTAICLPGIIGATVLYLRNRRH